jgi:ankyrin repeat protein
VAGGVAEIAGLLQAAGEEGATQLLRAVDNVGRTALDCAARHGRDAAVHLLIARGADATSGSALQEAAREGHVGIIDTLLKAGANVSAANARGETAHHLAAAGNHAAAIGMLVARGARLDAVKGSQVCEPGRGARPARRWGEHLGAGP